MWTAKHRLTGLSRLIISECYKLYSKSIVSLVPHVKKQQRLSSPDSPVLTHLTALRAPCCWDVVYWLPVWIHRWPSPQIFISVQLGWWCIRFLQKLMYCFCFFCVQQWWLSVTLWHLKEKWLPNSTLPCFVVWAPPAVTKKTSTTCCVSYSLFFHCTMHSRTITSINIYSHLGAVMLLLFQIRQQVTSICQFVIKTRSQPRPHVVSVFFDAAATCKITIWESGRT